MYKKAQIIYSKIKYLTFNFIFSCLKIVSSSRNSFTSVVAFCSSVSVFVSNTACLKNVIKLKSNYIILD